MFDSIQSPYNAPIHYRETVKSTMDESRSLAREGAPHGTVVVADYQEAGRGRIPARHWVSEPGANLLFTLLLRYPGYAHPRALTLRLGLAVSLAIEGFAPALQDLVEVKWPNDVMIRSRKVVGILTEGDGDAVYIGIGVNLAQQAFPPELEGKATSIALEIQRETAGAARDALLADSARYQRERLLELILAEIHAELEGNAANSWRDALSPRLYRRGCLVSFIPGGADASERVEGILAGIGPGGELLLEVQGEKEARSYTTGELRVNDRF